MRKEIKYKLQGNGQDSWEISEYEDEELTTRYMVYEDPNIPPIPEVDIIGLLLSQPTEKLQQIKQILNS